MTLAWLVNIGALLCCWLSRSRPEEKRGRLTKMDEFTECDICGDTFALSEMMTTQGATEKRCPVCFAELEATISGIQRD